MGPTTCRKRASSMRWSLAVRYRAIKRLEMGLALFKEEDN
jgi:hypothetical protein